MRAVPGGWAPDWSSRFFGEDIPHGLVVLRGLAELLDLPTPTIDRILLWAQRQMGREYLVDGRLSGADVRHSGAPQRFGISSLEQLPV
jgi:opine dehydrogenase